MDLHARNENWLDQNANRAYPLSADATRLDVSDTFQIPNDLLLDLDLAVHAGLLVDPSKFCIKTIGNFTGGLNIVVGYDTGTGVLPVAGVMIARATHRRGDQYRLGGIGDFIDATGGLVLGLLDNLDLQPGGQFQFDLTGGRLEPLVIRPMIRGISSLQIESGGNTYAPIYGDVILRAGRNMRITPIVEEGSDPIIRFDAIEGAGLNETCTCDGEAATPIATIGGIQPTTSGDFALLGSDCLEVQEAQHGVRLKDTCSEPCCGCEELETVTSALETVGRQLATLETFVGNLEARVTQMDQVLMGSRFGDRGCASS